jgi:hypothetical protein
VGERLGALKWRKSSIRHTGKGLDGNGANGFNRSRREENGGGSSRQARHTTKKGGSQRGARGGAALVRVVWGGASDVGRALQGGPVGGGKILACGPVWCGGFWASHFGPARSEQSFFVII